MAIKAEHVFEAARMGDKIAKEIIDNETIYLSVGLSNMIAIYNPDKIAIGGGVSSQWDILSEGLLEKTRQRALKPSFDACKIVKAELGVNGGLLGAAGLVMEK